MTTLSSNFKRFFWCEPFLFMLPRKGILLFLLGSLVFLHGGKAQTYQWSNVAIGGGGFVSGIVTSKTEKDLMYARTDVGGAYRWDKANNKWIPLLDWTSVEQTSYQGVESIALDPQASEKVYMLVGTEYFNDGQTAILKSSDYGETFTTVKVTSQFKVHGNGMGRQNGERLIVDPNKGSILFCGSRNNGLFKSTNAGDSWTKVSALNVGATANGNGVCVVAIDPASGTKGNASQTIVVGVSQTGTNLYMSTNGGTSFAPITGAPTSFMPQKAIITSDHYLYVTYAEKEGPWNSGAGQIWKYNLQNNQWTNVTPVGTTFAYGGISVDPQNPKRLIASSINVYYTQYKTPANEGVYGDRFFLSTDGGANWKDLVGDAGITLDPNGCTWIYGHSIHWAGCIEFNPFNTKQAMVISGNGVFTCDDVTASKTTWKFTAQGIEETVPLDIVSIPKGPLVSVIGDYDGFIHTDVTKYAPIHTPRMGTSTGIAYASLKDDTLLRIGDKMYYSFDQGKTWKQTTSINSTKGRVALSADGSVFLHTPEKASMTYRSTNWGASWTNVNGLSFSEPEPVADPVVASKFYAYDPNTGKVLVSTDGGANFSNAGTAGTGGSKHIRTAPGKEGHLWVPLKWGGLSRSTNSGQSFAKINAVSTCEAIGLGKAAPGSSYYTLYIWGTVNGVVGVFKSTNEGTSWERINDEQHQYGGTGNGNFVIGDMNTYNRVYMSTVGRGIVMGDASTLTGINEETFELNANYSIAYPNPFEQELHLQLKGAYHYQVYDLSGHAIASGDNDQGKGIGHHLLPGVYLLKVQQEQQTKLVKIIKK